MSGEQLAKEFDLPVPIKKEELKENKRVSINSKIPRDNIDLILEDDTFLEDLQQSENEILTTIQKLLNECKSFEEVYEKISLNYKNIEFKKLEEIMFKAVVQSQLRGVANDG